MKNVLRGGQKPATGLTPPGTVKDYHAPDIMRFDPAEARRLLAEAGYPDGKGFPPFEILINTSESHRTLAEAVQAMWKTHLKIPAGVLNQDWGVYLESQRALKFDVCRAGWVGDYLDPTTFLTLWALDARGVRGARAYILRGGVFGWDAIPALARRSPTSAGTCRSSSTAANCPRASPC